MRKNILLVDDDKHIQSLLTFILEQAGFEVKICGDGYTALEYLKKFPYDLAIFDISMPHMNGLKALRVIKSDPDLKNLPVLMLTASNDRDDVLKATELGAQDYVIKPPQKDDLLRRIERTLGGRPQFHEVKMDDQDKNCIGHFNLPYKLRSISRKGMLLEGQALLPKGFVIKDLNLPLFDEIGVSINRFVIAECKINDQNRYEYYISFNGIDSVDLDKINEWIMSETFSRNASGKKIA